MGDDSSSDLSWDPEFHHDFDENWRSQNMENVYNFGRGFKMKHPIFGDRDKEDVKCIFSTFEKFCRWYEIGEQDKIDALGLSLRQDTLLEFDVIFENGLREDLTYENIKNAIIFRFDSDPIENVIRIQINEIKLENYKSRKEFYSDLRKMGIKVGLDDESFLHAFTTGLPRNLEGKVVSRRPKTPQEALKIAQILEIYEPKSCGEADQV